MVALALLACGTPRSKFRHTGEPPAPRPLAWDGDSVDRGELRLEGALSHDDHQQNLAPELHDTALRVPTTTLDAVATLGLTRGLELGLRGSYASYDMAETTAVGTMPIPGEPAVWGLGPEARGVLDLSDRISLGFGGNALFYRAPVARWALSPECSTSPDGCVDGYRLAARDTEGFLLWSGAIVPSFHLDPERTLGHVFVSYSMHPTFQNDGFTDEVSESTGSTLETDGLQSYFGIGYGVRWQALVASGAFFTPIGRDDDIRQGPGFFVTLGGALRVFGDDAKPSSEGRRARAAKALRVAR